MGKYIQVGSNPSRGHIVKPGKRKFQFALQGRISYNTSSSTEPVTRPKFKTMKRKLETNEATNAKRIKTDYSGIVSRFLNENFVTSTCKLNHQTEFAVNKITSKKIKDTKDFCLHCDYSGSTDLFLTDELRASYENVVNKDLYFQIFDEISLEGLDGITHEAFWKRLDIALEAPLYINNITKELIWALICLNPHVTFFELPQPRAVLQIYNRYKYMDVDMGVVFETPEHVVDVYPYSVITLGKEEKGSCLHYNERKNITNIVRGMCLQSAVNIYGMKLVIVADQTTRKHALSNELVDPNHVFMDVEYCVLERIGRSRRHGETTQGRNSLLSLCKDSRTIFHHKKYLTRQYFLGKQFFYIKANAQEHNKTGQLMHLRRFYHKRKTKQVVIAELLINLLKQKPSLKIEYSELRKIFGTNMSNIIKVIKSSEFQRFVETDKVIYYRELYPDAKESEWRCKARPKERQLKIIELKDPTVNIAATWSDDSSAEDDDEPVVTGEVGTLAINVEPFKDAFKIIMDSGKEGISLQELKISMGLDIYTTRLILRKLLVLDTIDSRKIDVGRQRVSKYFAKYIDQQPDDIFVEEKPKPKPPTPTILANILKKQSEMVKLKANQYKDGNEVKQTEMKKAPLKIFTQFMCPHFITNLPPTVPRSLVKAKFIEQIVYFSLRLTWKGFNKNLNMDLSEGIPKIEPAAPIKWLALKKSTEVYTESNDYDVKTKVFLVKALLGEFEIDHNIQTLLANVLKEDHEAEIPPIVIKPEPPLTSEEKLPDRGTPKETTNTINYMGDNPITVIDTTEDGVNTKLMLSTPPAQFIEAIRYTEVGTVPTERVVARINLILEVVHQERIIEDITKLLRVIEDSEKRGGYNKKIDRKSIFRIYRKLVDQGYIKIFKVIISTDKKSKTQTFICHPSIHYNHTIIRSVCEQLKMRFFLATEKKNVKFVEPPPPKKVSPFRASDVKDSVSEWKQIDKMSVKLKYKRDRNIGKIYGFRPKFIRMQVFHEFLHYLVYEFDSNTQRLSNREVTDLFASYHIKLYESDVNSMPPIYCKELSWKMFIPPLIQHKGWPRGWALICDIVMRLPLSVLIKIHNTSFVVPEIQNYLNHPIKRHFLMKYISSDIRDALLHNKKYLSDIHDVTCRLAFIGLVQFGPKKLKEREQVFIYINQKASLLDTGTSNPSYHQIEEKPYKKLGFQFNTKADLDNYWYHLWHVSMNTYLGARNVMEGKVITLTDISAKPELTSALEARTIEEVAERDNGNIPGDQRGAAGIDSTLWPHITRNWCWATQDPGRNKDCPPAATMGLKKEKMAKVLQQNISYAELSLNVPKANKIFLHQQATVKPNKLVSKSANKAPRFQPNKTSRRIQQIKRKIVIKRRNNSNKYVDAIDNSIRKKLGVFKVQWDAIEDRYLLFSKVVSLFLNPNNVKKQLIPYYLIRDVLHKLNPKSRNKSSQACKRRIFILMSNEKTANYIQSNIPNLFKIKEIVKYFSGFIRKKISGAIPSDVCKMNDETSTAFVFLMAFFWKHAEEMEKLMLGQIPSLDHFSEENLAKGTPELEEIADKVVYYNDPQSEDDIRKDVIKSVVHSSLGARKDQKGWAYQLFKVYQKYPDSLIRTAVTEMKKCQLISVKKVYALKIRKPKVGTPFQLSNLYIYMLSTTFTTDTACEAYKAFIKLIDNDIFDFSLESFEPKKYGQLLAFNELASAWKGFKFVFDIPDQALILDPNVTDYSELIEEVSIRQQLRMKKVYEADPIDGSEKGEAEQTNEADKEVESLMAQPVIPESTVITDQTSPLDLSMEGAADTFDKLKSWVTDCMSSTRENRSPSPEFLRPEALAAQEDKALLKMSQMEVTLLPTEPKDTEPEISPQALVSIKPRDEVPTLDQIKEAGDGWIAKSTQCQQRGIMQETSVPDSREIPHITELSNLLTKESFPELDTSEEKLERLRKHFIPQYPKLENIVVENLEEFRENYIVEFIKSHDVKVQFWNKIKQDAFVKPPREDKLLETIIESGGKEEDYQLANDIVEFVFERGACGVQAKKIKEQFSSLVVNLELSLIMQILVDLYIVLRTGIQTISFVHYCNGGTWMIDTFSLSHDETEMLEKTKEEQLNSVIDNRLQSHPTFKITVTPWNKVDGSLNEPLFLRWLTNIMSYCLDHPKVSLKILFERFCYLKPVDLFYLLEILNKLGCIDLYLYDPCEIDLFSDLVFNQAHYATFLDEFEDMYVEVSNLSMVCLGSFITPSATTY